MSKKGRRDVRASIARGLRALRVMRVKYMQMTAQVNLGYTIIRSPITGIVGKTHVEVGQNVSIGEELIDVVSLNDVWITVKFKETQLVHLRPGRAG
jgi:membrane fusion protein, multidrug efflux system